MPDTAYGSTKREYSVYCYGHWEALTAKNVTSQVNGSVAKWQVCKIEFRLVQKYCLQCHIYFIVTSRSCAFRSPACATSARNG